ncbi:IS1478 transposase [Xanthomonas fragariae LMG 25863]|nr:IS1478 transposase [Xanthomonas fragariae LMG 25863]
MFRSRLENQIDLRHPLARLSQRMPWTALEQALSSRLPATQAGGGRPALPVRLIAGLLYLKHAYDLSDEAVCERWLENPYWQFFTGEVVFQTRLPSDASSLTRWRQRLGEAGMEELLAHTINAAHAMQAVDARELSRVIVDTTVQEKAIAYPTDSRLLEVARKKLVLLAKMRRVLRRQRTVLGRLMRDIQRKLDQVNTGVREHIAIWLERAQRLCTQRPKDKQKPYALHAPEVECIGKGKARQAYEFGVKVGIAVTACKGLVVGARSFPGNPYDGDTLADEQLEQTRGLLQDVSVEPTVAIVDLGDRGREVDGVQVPASRQGQDADATAMALDQATTGGGAGARTSERRLPVASLQAERCPRRCAARARLRRRLQPALAAALDSVFACLDAGDEMVILEHRAAVTDGTWRLKGIFQGRLTSGDCTRDRVRPYFFDLRSTHRRSGLPQRRRNPAPAAAAQSRARQNHRRGHPGPEATEYATHTIHLDKGELADAPLAL